MNVWGVGWVVLVWSGCGGSSGSGSDSGSDNNSLNLIVVWNMGRDCVGFLGGERV